MALLENMRIFVRVVELGSLSAAGRNLRMSPAMVSHRIQQLETHLGVRLLNRTTRQLQATETGMDFYQSCLEVLEAVERAQSSIAAGSGVPSGSVRVTAPLGFGRRILSPLVPDFCAAHPLVEVRLRLSDHLLDLLREAVDVAVRMAALKDSSFVVRKIADVRRVLVAAPSYLSERGQPSIPADLSGHNCLLLRFPGTQQYQWSVLDGGEPVKLPVSGRFDADDGDVLTGWALDGRGIAMKPLWEVAEHLASGGLVPVLPDFPPEPVTLAVLYPHRALVPAKVRAFADHMVPKIKAALTAISPDTIL
ncbi:DNA-binding transcriptional LysR family regulator [Azospirillum lipoferum]|uniref:LysR family transcriptional regulator n=1 Tax=Azospirillum lipoferum TaxID=193 RepID=A0A5A9GK10_AZOLI|nr:MULTISPECIES: LysR family transcriptional regulator [Azospirillum]KAA0594791.1 LysR family transcriptional regulator [Azospirillum lipoferum]MCP1612885.1 DNA-binding transcriptional LysR family regulator [Azospirillum lipoferum]MDW5532925.1 LysR family transcriptional regulator [Azospirillum sp. NL1]